MLCIVGDLAFGQVSGKVPAGILKLHRCVVVSFKEPVTTNTCMLVIFTRNSVNALQCIAFPIPFRIRSLIYG